MSNVELLLGVFGSMAVVLGSALWALDIYLNRDSRRRVKELRRELEMLDNILKR